MNYDPQKNAPRPIRPTKTDSPDESATPVDALLDGPKHRSNAVDKADSLTSVPGSPPLRVVPEPTEPNPDMPKLVALGAILALLGMILAYRLRRWVLGRADPQET
jgi:hypothetical protein